MFVDKFTRVECQSCGASFSVVDGSMDEDKYDVTNCAYCGDESIEIELEEVVEDTDE